MATASAQHKLDVRISFEVNENEARALDALAGYGDDAFVKAFYEFLGKVYMQPHEQGLRDFLQTIRKVVGPALSSVSEARKWLAEQQQKRTEAK